MLKDVYARESERLDKKSAGKKIISDDAFAIIEFIEALTFELKSLRRRIK